jgi:hypothetical protein
MCRRSTFVLTKWQDNYFWGGVCPLVLLLPVLLPEPLLDPEVLGGLVDGLPLPESGLVLVLGGFEVVPLVAPEVPCPELSVAELPELLLPELPVVAEPLLLVSPVVEPELLVLPLWPAWFWSCGLEGEAVLELLDPVCPLWVLMLPLLL